MLVDSGLRQDEEIVFNAGSHEETVKMRYADYERLVSPAAVAPLSRPA